jgi:NAD(P)-dependent dehydrogenase (short-subunit alcohol dehydrogenase family)
MSINDLFRLDGRVAAIVGAGSGIGEATAKMAASLGAHVVCLDVNTENATAVSKAIVSAGGRAEVHPLDIKDGASVRRCFDEFASRLGGLHAVVCTPAINVRKKILDYTEEEFDRVMAINMRGNFNVLQSAGRLMTAQKKGAIVLYSSIRSQTVEPGQSAYAATKAGILQMVRTAASEFGSAGVRVNAIGPGVIDTPLTAQIKNNEAWYSAYADKSIMKRWGRPEEVAAATLFLCSDAASYITGTILFVDGGWTAHDGRFTPPGM